jgi:hypothetical protein
MNAWMDHGDFEKFIGIDAPEYPFLQAAGISELRGHNGTPRPGPNQPEQRVNTAEPVI